MRKQNGEFVRSGLAGRWMYTCLVGLSVLVLTGCQSFCENGTCSRKDADRDGYPDCRRDENPRIDGCDCDDNDFNSNPGMEEICDQFDNDCDWDVDEGLTISVFEDADGDGFGDPERPLADYCPYQLPSVIAANSDDCDDSRADAYPGADEQCNGLDDDCNQLIDEGLAEDWFTDRDGDHHGDPSTLVQTCQPDPDQVQVGDDCDDLDVRRFPGNDEICDNGVDEDCDMEDKNCNMSGNNGISSVDGLVVYPEGSPNDLGAAVTSMPDFDGNGVTDFVVGSPNYMKNYQHQGRVTVFSIPADVAIGRITLGSTDSKDWTRTIVGNDFGERLGEVLAGGDYDGDGWGDVAIGVPDSKHSGFGDIYIFLGASLAATSTDETLNLSDADAVIEGFKDVRGFGRAIANAGDLNGDGCEDLLVGAQGQSGRKTGGYATTVFGGPTGISLSADSTMDGVLWGADQWTYGRVGTGLESSTSGAYGQRSEWAGASLAGLGDFGGSGESYVVIGAPNRYSAEGTRNGGAMLFRGLGDFTLKDLAAGSQSIVEGEYNNDRFGAAVQNIGDVNGDGYPDLAIGAPGSQSDQGAVYIFFGGDTPTGELADADVIVYGVYEGESFGEMITGIGDLNGDGFDDFAVAAPQADSLDDVYQVGSVAVFLGRDMMEWVSVDGQPADRVATGTLWGYARDMKLGMAGAGGDINGDDLDDLLLGTPAAHDGGLAWVVYGG